ncbi:MAG: HlyD family type I secretion periplasmic adaptor subunit [Magnetococcales bacterium]|nr:HlyD family type I secretion periplasmic adaptor subunit [Magnetococcales bacterium]
MKPSTPLLSDETIDDGVGWGHHLTAFSLLLTLFGLGIWAYWGKLDVVSITQGEVIPSSQVKQIQHLEGGIIKQILVKEGELVSKGQHLVELESISSESDLGEINARFISLRLERTRLEAEASGKTSLDFPPELLKEFPEKVARTRTYFMSRYNRQQEEYAGFEERTIQQQQLVQEIKSRIKNNEKRLKLVTEQISISEELLSREITNRFTHLELLKEANVISSAIEEDGMALLQAQAALKESISAQVTSRLVFQEEAQQKLAEIRGQISELEARQDKFSDSFLRRVIVSPVDGVVKSLLVFTEGGVLQPGGTALEIVPGADRLVIEARLPIQDIGYVRVGQLVKVSLSSNDAARFGKLTGSVVQISPDTLATEDGTPFYKVRIETEESSFKNGNLEYRLFPGMVIQAAIHTGSRTVLEYLLSPFMRYMDSALTER